MSVSHEFRQGDVIERLREMPDESIYCCVTSPPYWGLRDYGVEGQIGLEATPQEYVAKMVEVFSEVRRVLRSDGTLWLNLGDSFSGGKMGRADGDRNGVDGFTGGQKFKGEEFRQRGVPDGLKPKDLVGIPWRVAFALQDSGWWLRSDIIWAKPAPMPESVTDRPTRSHEYIFLLAKSEKYHCDMQAIAEPAVRGAAGSLFNAGKTAIRQLGRSSDKERVESETRNRRDVWTVNGDPFPEAHFATFPPALILPCILAGCPAGGTVLDPFSGAGTTALVATENGRNAVGIELNPDYIAIAERRLAQQPLPLEASA
jgi:DNA modification methylase